MRPAFLTKAAATVGLAALLAAAFACSGSSTSKPTATAVPAAATAAAPSAALSPTPNADEAAASVAGVGVALVDYKDPKGRYTVQVPRGWTRDEQPDLVTLTLPNRPLTTLGFYCQSGITAAELEAQDVRVVGTVGTRKQIAQRDVFVAGQKAIEIDSTETLSSTVLYLNAYYFEGRDCAWRVLMSSITGPVFQALLTRVMTTFTFVAQ